MSIAARRLQRGKGNAGSGAFRVAGSQILAPSGAVFVPLGANIAFYHYMIKDWAAAHSALGHSAQALEWGWNTVRIPAHLDVDKTLLGQLIAEYTAAGIVCIIDCHTLWTLADGNLGVNCSRIAEFDAWWQYMATTFKNNTYVWFNLHNEPPLKQTDWTDLHVRHTNIIRAAGARNIIVCDAPSGAIDHGPSNGAKYSWESDMLPVVIAAANGNVVLSNHNYGDRNKPSLMNDYITNVYAIPSPLLMGEFGLNVNDGVASTAGQWDVNYLGSQVSMDARSARGVGLTMWIANGNLDDLALKTGDASFWEGGSGNNLAGIGPRYWGMGHGTPGNKTYTWNWFANSRCIDTSLTVSVNGGWSTGTGHTRTYRTGQSWASYGTTTDISTDVGGYLRYYKTEYMADMPVGSYSSSFEANMPASGSLKIEMFWQDVNNVNVGSVDTQTYAVPSGKSTVNFTLTKPLTSAVSLFMTVTPLGYTGSAVYALTNFTTNRAEFFDGDTPSTAGTVYVWSWSAQISASAKVV